MSARTSFARRRRRSWREGRHDLHRQAQGSPPALQKNALGLTRRDYEGAISTLCAGCGHDSITAAIIQAFWELDRAAPVAKLSGIGCSSKTPDYFLGARTASTACTAACRRC
jgi:pyruvate/2-oxoacid:ferredoxin oxidoreductase beta subunit